MTGTCVTRGCQEPVACDSDMYCEDHAGAQSPSDHAANIAGYLGFSGDGDEQ